MEDALWSFRSRAGLADRENTDAVSQLLSWMSLCFSLLIIQHFQSSHLQPRRLLVSVWKLANWPKKLAACFRGVKKASKTSKQAEGFLSMVFSSSTAFGFQRLRRNALALTRAHSLAHLQMRAVYLHNVQSIPLSSWSRCFIPKRDFASSNRCGGEAVPKCYLLKSLHAQYKLKNNKCQS